MSRTSIYEQGGVKIYQSATPVGLDAHHDVPLSNFASAAFDTDDASFVADRLFPTIPVGKQSDRYYRIEKHSFYRIPSTLRAPSTEPRRVEFRVSSDGYFADNYALAAENPLEDLNNADAAIMLRENSVALVQWLLRLDQETRVANLVTSISNVGSGVQLTGADSWFSVQSADIIGQVHSAQAFMRSQTGLLPNTLVVDWNSIQAARRNTRLFEFFKHTGGAAGMLSIQQLNEIFDVDRILVGRMIKNDGVEDADADNWSSSNVWGNNAVFAHVGPNTGLRSRTLGGRFRWQPPIWPANFAVLTDVKNRAGEARVEVVDAGYYQDEKIIAPDLGYCINTSSGSTGAA